MAVTDGVTGLIYKVMKERGSAQENAAMDVLREAERFVFQPPYLTMDLFKGGIEFADQLAVHGMLRLPFDTVTFQFGPIYDDEAIIAPIYHHVALAWMEGGDICGRFYICTRESVCPSYESYRIPGGATHADAVENKALALSYVTRDEGARAPSARVYGSPFDGDPEFDTVGVALFMMTLFGSLGCLGAAGVRLESVRTPKFTNQQRERKGDAPVFGHNVVMIDMDQIRMPGVTRAGGAHASPRLHWRRGHIRRASSGKLSVVRPCLVGCVDRGVITKDYVVGAASASMLAH